MPQRSPAQYTLDFEGTRSEKYSLIRALNEDRTGLRGMRLNYLISFLSACHDFDSGQGCFASVTTIARTMHSSVASARRAKRYAADHGLVAIERRAKQSCDGGRLPDVVRIDWAALAGFGRVKKHAGESVADATSDCEVSALADGVSALADRVSALRERYIKEEYHIEYSTPTTTNDRFREDWRGVEEFIFSECRVNQARKAVDKARDRGTTMADIWRIVAYWRRHRDAWRAPEYALYERLCRGMPPGSPIGEGWLPWQSDYADRRSREARRLREQRVRCGRDFAANEIARRWNGLEAAQREQIKQGLLGEYRYLRKHPRRLRSLLIDLCGREDLGGPLAELLAPLRTAKCAAKSSE